MDRLRRSPSRAASNVLAEISKPTVIIAIVAPWHTEVDCSCEQPPQGSPCACRLEASDTVQPGGRCWTWGAFSTARSCVLLGRSQAHPTSLAPSARALLVKIQG